jgi:hypothetical protein
MGGEVPPPQVLLHVAELLHGLIQGQVSLQWVSLIQLCLSTCKTCPPILLSRVSEENIHCDDQDTGT